MEDQPLRNCYIDSRGKGYTFLSKANIGPVYKTDKKRHLKTQAGGQSGTYMYILPWNNGV